MAIETAEIPWKDYLRVAWKRRWLVLSVVLVVTVSTFIYISTLQPMFSTSAQVLIERGQQVLGNQYAYNYYYDLPTYIETQLRLIRAEDFLKKVADELNNKSPSNADAESANSGDPYSSESFHEVLSGLRTITGFFRGKQNPSSTPIVDRKEDVQRDEGSGNKKVYHPEQIAGGLSVRLIPKTEILEISSTRPDPFEAALIANAVAESFIRERLDRRLGAVQDAIVWLQKQLKNEQVDLDKSRIELYEFMNKYGILSIDEKRGTKLDEELKLMGEKVRAAKENTATLHLRYEQVAQLATSPNLIDTIPEAMTNKVLADLRGQEIQLEQEAIKLSATYGSNHPRIMALERQVKNLRSAKSQEIQKIINSLKVQYETARLQEQSIIQARDGIQGELEDLQKRTVRYFTLKREVESNEKVYDVVLNRLKETSLTEEFAKSPNASIINHAMTPRAPSSPNVQRHLTMGVALAILLSIGLAVLLEFLDKTITRPDQIEQQLGLTFLGAVPSFNSDTKSKTNGAGGSLIALTNPKSSAAEAYRALRTSVLLSSADVQPQVLLVTSPGKSEGKSLSASNLAIVMAQAGNRVLLIDCDLRKPKLHKMFDLERDRGLSTMLVGRKLEREGFLQKTAEPNLELITCGPIPPNPSELLGSKRMHTFLDSLRQDYDRIILDSPPILAATDAAVLTPFVDGTILIVRSGDTTRQMAQRAIKLLMSVNTRITGVVLNEIMIGRDSYYYYDYYYCHYGKYYGDEDSEEKSSWLKRRNHRKSVETDELSQ